MRTKSIWDSFRCAFTGLKYVWMTQRNAKIHTVFATLVGALAIWLRLSVVENAILVMTVSLVFAGEIANTVAETIVDLASPEYHQLARIAKDAAAAGVLILAGGACIVGALILIPPLWELPWR